MKFNDLINQDKPILVDFFADWCGPCQTMEPILEEVKTNIGDTAQIIKIDVDKNPMAAAAFKVRSVPTFMLFKNGEILWRKSGMVRAKELEEVIFANK